MSYNLVDEPWIDVIYADGKRRSIGLSELFRDAHLIKDMTTATFRGVTFPFYNYLVLRLCCGILADAYNDKEETFDAKELLSEKEFDMSEGSAVNEYFEKYKPRFDLFDKKHPFMQAGEEDIAMWRSLGCTLEAKEKNILKINPCAPAESARITEVRAPEMAKMLQAVGCSSPQPLYGFDLKNVDSNTFTSTITDIYAIPAKEWAYICLYHNCTAPGVGAGNKSSLAGNAFYAETLQGKNMFQTIVMNSIAIAQSKHKLTDKPIWRWESQGDLFFNPNEVEFSNLSGLFCPAKVFAADKVENNIVRSVSQSPMRFKENVDKNFLENLRQKWAIEYEPHFVVNYKDFPMKKEKDKTEVRDYAKNPYRSMSAGASRLWTLVGATQTKIARIEESDFKKLAMAAKNTRKRFGENGKPLFLDDDVHIRNYFRICDSHWVYQATGTQDGTLPFALFLDEEKQLFVRKTIEYVSNVSEKLDECARAYLKRSDIRPSLEFSTAMYSFLGINGEHEKFFRKIADTSKKDDLDKLWDELTLHLNKTAKAIFNKLLMPAKIPEFYAQMSMLGKAIYGKKGEKLYVRNKEKHSK